MSKLDDARKIINDCDKELIDLFKKRFVASKMVAEYKKENNIPILDKTREDEIIKKNLETLFDKELEVYFKDFYLKLLDVSKQYQNNINGLKFGLIGEKLSHSYSPLIHNLLFKLKGINATYDLIEVTENELEKIVNKVRNYEYQGFNVTIPYKVKIMDYLDVIDAPAAKIGAVNTIYMRDGLIHGTNTDYFGFIDELRFYNINVFNKDVYVLGNGGASKACVKALEDLSANVKIVSRTKTDNTITYDELANIKKIDVIVNTTPVGMYPNNSESPISKIIADKALLIVDIIFNPSQTLLMSYNKNSYNGLMMLIKQAAKSEDIWLKKEYDLDYNEIYNQIKEMI